MKDSLHTLIFSAALGLVCALLLTGAAELTRTRRNANAKAEKIRNILGVLKVSFDRESSAEELAKVFKENVREDKHGEFVTYAYVPADANGEVQAVAVPFAGPGLWGPIKGLLALEKDMVTIRGVTFYEQEETPGLGGEIAAACNHRAGTAPKDCAAWFRHQFGKKSIQDKAGTPGIRILRGGGAVQQNEVDAITGATMTCQKVEVMINEAIMRIAEERNSNGG